MGGGWTGTPLTASGRERVASLLELGFSHLITAKLFFCLFVFLLLKKFFFGVPIMAQQLMNLTSIHETAGSIPDLAQRIPGCSDLWCRPAATALI